MNVDNLKKAREKAGYTQLQAAEKLGISDGTYKNYEQGKREPNGDKIVALADLFNVSTDYLLGRPEAPEPKSAIDSLIEEHSLHAIEESLLRMYFKLEPKKRAEFMQSVLDDVQKNMLEEKQHKDGSISVTTTLGEIEDRVASEEEAHAKDAG